MHVLRSMFVAAIAAVFSLGVGCANAQTQISLTDKQVQSFIAMQKDLGAVIYKVRLAPPDPEVDQMASAQLEALAWKYGFTNFTEYSNVAETIGLIFEGIDPQAKTFTDPMALLKARAAQIQADTTIAAADKQQAIAQINAALQTMQPIQNQASVALVLKYYDQLAAATP